DWRLRFRTLSTPHFDVHAHQGEEALAERLGAIAEQVRSRFAPVFGVPPGRVHVILADQAVLSNVSATPLPYDPVEITPLPPVAGAAAHGQFEPMDRAAGGLDRWPSGDAAYAYGGYFHQYLADRFGAEKLVALADATSGRVPYFGTGAFRRVFGESVGTLEAV